MKYFIIISLIIIGVIASSIYVKPESYVNFNSLCPDYLIYNGTNFELWKKGKVVRIFPSYEEYMKFYNFSQVNYKTKGFSCKPLVPINKYNSGYPSGTMLYTPQANWTLYNIEHFEDTTSNTVTQNATDNTTTSATTTQQPASTTTTTSATNGSTTQQQPESATSTTSATNGSTTQQQPASTTSATTATNGSTQQPASTTSTTTAATTGSTSQQPASTTSTTTASTTSTNGTTQQPASTTATNGSTTQQPASATATTTSTNGSTTQQQPASTTASTTSTNGTTQQQPASTTQQQPATTTNGSTTQQQPASATSTTTAQTSSTSSGVQQTQSLSTSSATETDEKNRLIRESQEIIMQYLERNPICKQKIINKDKVFYMRFEKAYENYMKSQFIKRLGYIPNKSNIESMNLQEARVFVYMYRNLPNCVNLIKWYGDIKIPYEDIKPNTNEIKTIKEENGIMKYIQNIGSYLQDLSFRVDDLTRIQKSATNLNMDYSATANILGNEMTKYLKQNEDVLKKMSQSTTINKPTIPDTTKTQHTNFNFKPSYVKEEKQPSNEIYGAFGWSFMPPQSWSVPQKRPPACIPQQGAQSMVTPIYDKSVPVDALDWTQVGSILPKFEYKEVYNPNYYHPGWIAGETPNYPFNKDKFKSEYYGYNLAKDTK